MDARTTNLSRRRFLGMAAGAAAATCLPFGNVTAFAAPKNGGNGRLVVPGKMGTITYTQRDVPGRIGIAAAASLGVSPTMGYLGGPDFPNDPDDLGDLVPLPGGWHELLEYLANLGYKQIEFAGYGQNAANPGGAAPNPAPGGVTTPESRAAYLAYAHVLRGFLDEFDLEAIGNHGFIPNTWPGPGSANGAMSENDYNRYQTELEFAAILGTPFMGTGNDPTSANNRNVEAWDLAGEKWQALNELSLQWGIHLYPHNHSPAYNFLQDGPMVEVTEHRTTGEPIAPTMVRAESGKRLMQHYLDITDPDLCLAELDIYWAHVAQHQHRWRYDENGNRVEDIFDPLAQVATQTHRYPLFHAKDGAETGQEPGVGNGYGIVPFGTGDIGFQNFFKNMGAKGSHNPNYEQDNAPGGGSDPGRSLRHSAISAGNMTALRG
ncbi:sugar phosphate isomerase/epimerase family protein [Salsipaludibacter albus]|uniref:sugar phosphate isomerase/epimerase family protein n=1 Tax=Salsipaludibacter albus TaxID=2849650 RepID=UPI001EE4291C|nr:TIM barrel protein [Salsipaludibacter albus]MBY5162269.1 sugar phosphate isomerase/epimerase [Salsipaludibacter albus]